MTRQRFGAASNGQLSRRRLLKELGTAAGIASVARPAAARQTQSPPGKPVDPPTTITNPPRDFGPGAPPTTYPDPDVLVIDPASTRLRTFNSPIARLLTAALWP